MEPLQPPAAEASGWANLAGAGLFAYTACMPDIHTLRRILGTCKTLAVVGLSPQWHRPSFFAAKYMQGHGYRIVPVNPAATEILGERSYPSVTAAAEALAAQGQRIDLVDCFRKSQDIPPIADEAIAIGARCLWLQIGVIHEPAAAKARAAGLDVVMDRCVKIEHARLFGGLGWAGVDTRVISSRRPQHLPY
jgi:uncharacterized protein